MPVLRRHCTSVIDIAPDEWALLRDLLRRLVPTLGRLFHLAGAMCPPSVVPCGWGTAGSGPGEEELHFHHPVVLDGDDDLAVGHVDVEVGEGDVE